jgi:hypothetical protein
VKARLTAPAIVLLLAVTSGARAQIGKEIDTAMQKEKIHRMPTDTSGLQQGKQSDPSPGGERSGKNTDYQRQKPVKPDSTPKSRKKKSG